MNQDTILVTGAAGLIGSHLCRQLAAERIPYLATDLPNSEFHDDRFTALDLRNRDAIATLFASQRVSTVIHLAAILPTAARNHPELATQVNVLGSCNLVEIAATNGVSRFLFGSSMAVYGLTSHNASCTEGTSAKPEDIYGAAKRYIELYGMNTVATRDLEFVSLRIATVVGLGARNTASPWRSQIFDPLATQITIPCGAEAVLSTVHAEDVAEILTIMAKADSLQEKIYNTPAERWRAGDLKARIESLRPSVHITLDEGSGRPTPPVTDGARFQSEFHYSMRPILERLRRVGS
jgi:nucleoside-diphosphate-sugar epimerase